MAEERDAGAKEKREALQAVEALEQQLAAKGDELQQLAEERDMRATEKREAWQEFAKLKQRLESAHASTRDAQEKANLILLQLNQVQEEAERYFLLSRKKSVMLASSELLNKRIADLVSGMRE